MKYLYRNLIIAITCVTTTSLSFCQTVDEIINEHIIAHGGMENWEAIKSIKTSGQFTSFSEVHAFTEFKTACGKYYFKHNFGQHPRVEGYDRQDYWVDDPWFELGFPHMANDAETNVIKQRAVFCTPFFNYQENGYSVTYEGIEKAEGKDAHKLFLTKKDGSTETWFLDTQTYLAIMSTSSWADFAYPTQQQSFYDDFRKVGDVILPFYIERVFSIRHRVTEIENIEINAEIDPDIFNFPLNKKMKDLKFMEGNWSVILETMGRSGQLQRADSTTSVINFVDGNNLLQENINYTNYFPIKKINNWSYNSDLKNYLMTTYNSFYSTTTILQGNFSSDTLTFETENIKFSDKENDQMAKYHIIIKDNNSFVFDIYRSTDAGENWTMIQRLTYQRVEE